MLWTLLRSGHVARIAAERHHGLKGGNITVRTRYAFHLGIDGIPKPAKSDSELMHQINVWQAGMRWRPVD
jgi:hypothetical protein